jgi:dTDP-4-amino-4,6-dideoxygalactose transaminase
MKPALKQIPLVDLAAQYASIKKEIDKAVQQVMSSAVFIGGDEVKKFAVEFANIANTPYCIPCANGTDAIEIALKALGIGKGDEVIIPAFSFVATLEAVCNVGATPVLCDVEPDRLTINVKKIKSLITCRTKAIIPVHLYGQMADMKPIMSISKKYGLDVIEDAAQAHKAEYNGLLAGSIGHFGAFSFYPGKNLGAYGDAGALTTSNEKLFRVASKIANHGRIQKYDHDIVGRNSRMDAIQAAVLNVKAQHLEDWIKSRRKQAAYYDNAFKKLERELSFNIQLPKPLPESQSVYHLYVIRVKKKVRDELRTYLSSAGIETGIHYPVALSKLKAVRKQLKIKASCPVAEKASHKVLSLPLYPELKQVQQDYIIEAIRSFIRISKKSAVKNLIQNTPNKK